MAERARPAVHRNGTVINDDSNHAGTNDEDEGVKKMGSYPSGALLTCIHDDCGCRVRVEVECSCPGAADAYRCTCGAEMLKLDNAPGTSGGSVAGSSQGPPA
jgi:metallothionein